MSKRFQTPPQGNQYPSEYDFGSDMLVDLNQRDISPLSVVTLNLAVAGTYYSNMPGRAWVAYFWQTGSAIKARKPAGFLSVYINQNAAVGDVFTAKHNRGYRGSYSQNYFTWAAQSGISVDIVFLKSKSTPWMTDALITTSGGGGGGVTLTVNPQTANYNVLATDNAIPVNATGGNVTIALGAGTTTGQVVIVNKTDTSANTVTVTGGLLGSVVLNNQGDAISFYFDGTAWNPWA